MMFMITASVVNAKTFFGVIYHLVLLKVTLKSKLKRGVFKNSPFLTPLKSKVWAFLTEFFAVV